MMEITFYNYEKVSGKVLDENLDNGSTVILLKNIPNLEEGWYLLEEVGQGSKFTETMRAILDPEKYPLLHNLITPQLSNVHPYNKINKADFLLECATILHQADKLQDIDTWHMFHTISDLCSTQYAHVLVSYS